MGIHFWAHLGRGLQMSDSVVPEGPKVASINLCYSKKFPYFQRFEKFHKDLFFAIWADLRACVVAIVGCQMHKVWSKHLSRISVLLTKAYSSNANCKYF